MAFFRFDATSPGTGIGEVAEYNRLPFLNRMSVPNLA